MKLAKKQIPTVSLAFCSYTKKCKKLTLASEYCGMPQELRVISNITGKIVNFVPVGPDHPMFDEDGYDGEQAIYRPTVAQKNVDYLVIYNQF